MLRIWILYWCMLFLYIKSKNKKRTCASLVLLPLTVIGTVQSTYYSIDFASAGRSGTRRGKHG